MKIRNEFIYAAAFTVGVAVGSLATWKVVKTKYEKIAQEEIDSVKDVYSKKTVIKNEAPEVFIEHFEDNATLEEKLKDLKIVTDEYTSIIRKQEYSNEPEKVKPMVDKPYVISPEEYGELGYEQIELTYYADKVLADDQDEIVEDVDMIVGYDSLDSFGDYEDDSVHVRNDAMEADYEILLDSRKYYDLIPTNESPHPVEEE